MRPHPAPPPRYIPVSSPRTGALGILHIHAGESVLAARIDAAVQKKTGNQSGNPLELNELCHGWFKSSDGLVLDEVMIARPGDGTRILMTHGGKAVRSAVTAYLWESGFQEASVDSLASDPSALPECDPALASCITEAQAAAVLASRITGTPVPGNLLKVHRLVLAGAPNAGKSSLLNRLAGYDRAFVHAEAGATRDIVDELIDLGGYAVLMGDLPGYRRGEEGGGIAREAWTMAKSALLSADAVLFVADASLPWEGETARAAEEVAAISTAVPVLIILNKSDLPVRVRENAWRTSFPRADAVRVTSLEGGDARDVVARAITTLFR